MIKIFFLLLLILTSTIMEAVAQTSKVETATFGAGCFWCVEAIYQRVKGVIHVESGYSGGTIKNPSYHEVSSGRTGHVEVVRILFDPTLITYEQLLEVFWHTHDPTTKDRQGNDVGPQYRSVIFYHSEAQREVAEASKKRIESSGLWKNPIVTVIEPLKNYYKAEDYHQNYFNDNPMQPYCSFVIAPKIAKFQKEFKHLLKQ